MIKPHNNILVNKILSREEAKLVIKNAQETPILKINHEQVKDVKNIARGAYSPLSGFLGQDDFKRVVSEMRLPDGAVWPIPIVLDVSDDDLKKINGKNELLLVEENNNPIALLKNIEIYSFDKDFFAKNVFGTTDQNHPGVEGVYKMKEHLIGGEIELLDNSKDPFGEYNFTPLETRKIFADRGWQTVVAFQTRNVPHIAHEFLQKQALKETDGLFVQPVVGEKKLEDFKDEYILGSYEILIEKYFPKNKVVLGILPLKMRYAGPREAIFHALIRKNFGCTHFIVGRDHAGVGDYYSPFAAQEIFDDFAKEEINITILKYPEVVYNSTKQKHTFIDQTPEKDRASFSGTKLRQHIKNKVEPPSYIIRSEVYDLLANSHNSLVDRPYKERVHARQKGFVLWITGLSQSGKTTVAERVFKVLEERGIKSERLDGNVLRETLSQDLGFSKEDRDENIRRAGFVANLLANNGMAVVASFISPYQKERDQLRKRINNFIEVYIDTPLEICEKRDTNKLYQKARKGEIKNFTGISDPYQAPKNPELHLSGKDNNIEQTINKTIKYLEDQGFIPGLEASQDKKS